MVELKNSSESFNIRLNYIEEENQRHKKKIVYKKSTCKRRKTTDLQKNKNKTSKTKQ